MPLFTEQTVRRALAAASERLRAASVTAVWLDMSGAGWTETFCLVVDVAAMPTRSVPVRPRSGATPDADAQTVEMPVLPPEARAAVVDTLAHLPRPARVDICVDPFRGRADGVQVWPLEPRIDALRAQVSSLEAQIAALESDAAAGADDEGDAAAK